MNRRGFFGFLLAPFIAKFLPSSVSCNELLTKKFKLGAPEKLFVALYTSDGKEVSGNGYSRRETMADVSLEGEFSFSKVTWDADALNNWDDVNGFAVFKGRDKEPVVTGCLNKKTKQTMRRLRFRDAALEIVGLFE